MLKNELYGKDEIFPNYALNFTPNEKDVLKGLANEEQSISFDNLFLNQVILALKRFGRSYEYNLLNEKIIIRRAKQE